MPNSRNHFNQRFCSEELAKLASIISTVEVSKEEEYDPVRILSVSIVRQPAQTSSPAPLFLKR